MRRDITKRKDLTVVTEAMNGNIGTTVIHQIHLIGNMTHVIAIKKTKEHHLRVDTIRLSKLKVIY